MAKIMKMPQKGEDHEKGLPFTFDDVLATLPEDVKKEMEKEGIKSFDDLIRYVLTNGIDPMKLVDMDEEKFLNGDFDPEDIMLDDEFFDDEYEDDEYEDDEYDDDFDDGDYEDDESYHLGMTLPKVKFIGKPKREFHIRIKLNDAPVSIWRELVVPSNITLEMLAYVLLDAMGWKHEHLYHFIGKDHVEYVNSYEMKAQRNSFLGFLSHVEYKNSEKTTLEMVLQPKGNRMKFEYDYGDSWIHDLWVKGVRDYALGEEPVVKLLKAAGDCPPEDCGGVWGYAELLELNRKKRKTAEDRERLDWYEVPKNYHPEECDLEWLQEEVEDLWLRIKDEMKKDGEWFFPSPN